LRLLQSIHITLGRQDGGGVGVRVGKGVYVGTGVGVLRGLGGTSDHVRLRHMLRTTTRLMR
jgi:hypothetical protein